MLSTLLLPLVSAQAERVRPPKLTVLHHFKAAKDGGQPSAALTPDGAGGFYTTAEFGGPQDLGVAIRLTPPDTLPGKWSLKLLHGFTGAPDGSVPDTTLIAAPDGTLYGTTFVGGAADNGSVFSLTPPVAPATRWKFKILHSFTSAGEGERLQGQLLLTDDGSLLGTAYQGGSSNSGTVYMLTPPVTGSVWTFTLLHAFDGILGGGFPLAGLTLGSNGVYYGTTSRGGANDRGTVYSLTPPTPPAVRWKYKVLYSFELGNVPATGGVPMGDLLIDTAGVLYGTTSQGGGGGRGTVFSLGLEGHPKAWQYHLLHSFATVAGDGDTPEAGLIADAAGALYGTTTLGGDSNHGTIFKLTPPVPLTDPWIPAVLHSFNGTDGATPAGSLVMDDAGLFYGTASAGGKFSKGTVFSFRP